MRMRLQKEGRQRSHSRLKHCRQFTLISIHTGTAHRTTVLFVVLLAVHVLVTCVHFYVAIISIPMYFIKFYCIIYHFVIINLITFFVFIIILVACVITVG